MDLMDSLLLERVRARRIELEVSAARERDVEEALRLEGSLIDFVESAWPAIDPAEYQSCWAIDALCEHLQAVSEGQIRHLLVNAPPRCSKTTLASIFYPAWTWAQSERTFLKGPQVRFLCGSYNHDLSLTNSNSTRRLILSPWYQSLWGQHFKLREDQNTKTKFDTSAGGSRLATSVGGSLLGIGGDVLIVDDPHNTEEAESDADRKTALTWWKELSTTRLNNPKQSPLIVIMQRLHEEDVSGHILSSEWSGDWCHLMIPMQYEHRRHCVTVLGWQDPRGLDESGEKLPDDEREEREGTLMWPERFGTREIARIKAELGPYFSSGRLQQMPVPDKGGIFQRDWWHVYESPDGKFPPMDHIVVSVDGAFTEKEENDPSACTVWGCFEREGEISKIMFMAAWRKWLPFHGPQILKEPNETVEAFRRRTQKFWGLLEWIEYTADRFHAHTVLIEAKGPGLSAAQSLQSRFGIKPWSVIAAPVKGDKVARAFAAQPTFAQGLVYAPIRDWSDLVISEMANFPKGKYDDLTDSATQAINYLRTAGRAPSREEWAVNQEMGEPRRRLRLTALYPC
jgi:predicted phage terminase large subunit-like protein